MKILSGIIVVCILTSCNLFHSTPEFEMERMAEDVLSSKGNKGISITIVPIEENKDKK